MRLFSTRRRAHFGFFPGAIASDPSRSLRPSHTHSATGIDGVFARKGYLFSPGRRNLAGPTYTAVCRAFPYRFRNQRPTTMPCRGVRGATTVEANEREAILTATRQLLALLIRRNGIERADIASVIFTVTKDLSAEFPALAARQLGWSGVPLLCGYEIDVPGSLPLCIRILVHWNTDKTAAQVHHVYARGAERLRPDLESPPEIDLAELEAWITKQMAGGA
jgi:chorismate mutase